MKNCMLLVVGCRPVKETIPSLVYLSESVLAFECSRIEFRKMVSSGKSCLIFIVFSYRERTVPNFSCEFQASILLSKLIFQFNHSRVNWLP